MSNMKYSIQVNTKGVRILEKEFGYDRNLFYFNTVDEMNEFIEKISKFRKEGLIFYKTA